LIHIKVGETLIETTEGHPFWVVGYGFKYSHDLEVGDHVITAEGIEAEITFVETVEVEPTTTYNFEVEDWHTYFVSDAEVWVHNSSGKCDDVVEEAAEALGKGGSDVPNPYGKKGGPAHRSVVESITPKSKGNIIDTEVKIDTTGGHKPYRYADAIEYNKEGKAIAIYQVGKANKNGTVIPRESRAIEDIMSSDDYRGVPVYFLPYNSDIGEIIFDY
jgi:hypothetical protein